MYQTLTTEQLESLSVGTCLMDSALFCWEKVSDTEWTEATGNPAYQDWNISNKSMAEGGPYLLVTSPEMKTAQNLLTEKLRESFFDNEGPYLEALYLNLVAEKLLGKTHAPLYRKEEVQHHVATSDWPQLVVEWDTLEIEIEIEIVAHKSELVEKFGAESLYAMWDFYPKTH